MYLRYGSGIEERGRSIATPEVLPVVSQELMKAIHHDRQRAIEQSLRARQVRDRDGWQAREECREAMPEQRGAPAAPRHATGDAA
jgi:hypothetical protein